MNHDIILASFEAELTKIAQATVEEQGMYSGMRSGSYKGPKGVLLGGLLGRFRATTRQKAETAKKQVLVKGAQAWGKNVGRSWGRGSAKGGWSTKFRSAGIENPKPVSKALPNLPGAKLPAVKNQPMPKQVAETNNQVTLRRGLSNIELPEPR